MNRANASSADDHGGDGKDGGESPGVLALIAAIQDGSLNGRTMDVRDRRACVEHLAAEGYSVVETAGVLRVSERSVARDRAANAEANALRHDPRLAGQMAGRLVNAADACVSRIRRATRAADTSASVKVQAEQACWQIVSDLTARLQSLAYLPTAAQQLAATVTHNAAAVPSAAEMAAEVERLERIRRDLLPDRPELDQQLNLVRGDVAALTAHERVRQATLNIEQELHHDDDDRSY